MLRWIVGNVDVNSASVLVAVSICLCVVITALIAKRRSAVDVSNEYELAKIKLQNERMREERKVRNDHELGLANIASKRDIEMKRIDSNMITSHTSSTAGPEDT